MRRIREILRLKHECRATDREIARSLSVARSTVALTLERVAAAGLRWPLPATLTDLVLEAMLYTGHGGQQGARRKADPDWAHVHHELRRPGVTLMLLWEEYRQREPDGYLYSRWRELYRAWESRLSPTIRQAHPAGERMFVDNAGQTIDLTDGRTGEIRPAQIFVAVMGAPNYTYAEADPDPDFAGLDRRACQGTGLHGWRAGAARARQPQGRGRSCKLVRTWPEPHLSRSRDPTAPPSCRRAPANRATKPRLRSPCWWSSAGFWRG